MLTIVTYDISDNKIRSYFIKKLQSYGLYRIQKSVFAGYLTPDDRLDLASELESYLSSDNDSIIILPLCKNCKSSILYDGEVAIPNNELNYRFLWD